MSTDRRLFLLGMLTTAAAVPLTAVATATSVSAGTVAPDAYDVVRPIVFPIVGKSTYTDTFGACRSGCTRRHEGIDVMAAKLTLLVATRDATVAFLKDAATPDGSQGNYLMLRDAQGWGYFYVHVNNDTPGTDDGANPKQWIFAPGIVQGSKVKAGQLVGYVGDSGNAEGTAPHLHFEIHKPDGSVINPYKSLEAATKLAAPVGVDGTVAGHTSFVKALHQDFLGRAATDVEVAAHVAALGAGRSRAEVVGSFAGSDEWIRALVDGYYQDTLGRVADGEGRRHWINVLRSGVAPAVVAAEFYASAEYFARVGGTNGAWIGDLYRVLLHRAPEVEGAAYWVAQLAGGAPRREAAYAVYQSLESRLTRVTGLYQALLGREPDGGGRTYWAGVLADGQDLRLAVNLATSDEYYRRAGTRFPA